MYSGNTVTSFVTFSPGTLIRSSDFNANFAMFRGNVIPIDPTTATAPNLTYDLGRDGASWMNNYSGVWVATAQSTPAANPSTTTMYKLYMKSDGKLYKLNSTGTESQAGGSGGGGASIVWEEPGNAPVKSIINNMAVYSFVAAASQELYCEVKVPSSYSAGTQINLKAVWYSADSSGNVLLQTVATLIRNDTDVVSSTTNQRTSTNTAVTMSGTNQNKPQAVTFDLTDTSGQINGVAIAANDTIVVKLTRGTDTATGNVGFLHKQCEVV